MHPCIGNAGTRADELKLCLADFDGIEWKLPYQPPINIRACASPTARYDASEVPAEGRRRLELIGELTLAPDDGHLNSDDTYVALQAAALTHFEALFIRRGYRRVAVEYGDARTRYYRRTMRMLHSQRITKEDEEADDGPQLPPIPYINLARYVRSEAGRDITLTYKCDAKNTWLIQIEGLPAAGQSGAKP